MILDGNPFLLMALFAAISASVVGGIIGSYVVVKRIVFISGSIAHSVLGGLGVCLFLQRYFDLPWLDPLYGALVFALLSAYLIGWIHLNYKQREDTVIAAIWASGMSIGVIFLSLTPGYNVEVMTYLFGNILWTSPSDIILLAILDVIVVCAALLMHRRFLAICFDETQAYLQGLAVRRLYFVLLSLVALSVVLMIKVVGAILVIAMLSLPPAIAGRFTHRLSRMICLAIIITMILSAIGLGLSSTLNWPPGATISLATTIAYFIFVKK